MTQQLTTLTSPVVTTSNEIQGHTVRQNLGIVRGIVVRSPNLAQGIFGIFRSLLGGNIGTFESICERARQEAYHRMVLHATEIGADAVLAMRYDATEFMSGMTEVLAYGTAVKLEPPTDPR